MLSTGAPSFALPDGRSSHAVLWIPVSRCALGVSSTPCCVAEVQHHRITRFNGTPVVSLRQLAGLVLACTASEMRFELEGGTLLVLDSEEARQDTRQVGGNRSALLTVAPSRAAAPDG